MRRTRANNYEEPMEQAESTQSDQLSGEDDVEMAMSVAAGNEGSPTAEEQVQAPMEHARPARSASFEAASEPAAAESPAPPEEATANTCDVGDNEPAEGQCLQQTSTPESVDSDIAQWETSEFQDITAGAFDHELDAMDWADVSPLDSVLADPKGTPAGSVALTGQGRTLARNSFNAGLNTGVETSVRSKSMLIKVAEESLQTLKRILSTDSSQQGINPV